MFYQSANVQVERSGFAVLRDAPKFEPFVHTNRRHRPHVQVALWRTWEPVGFVTFLLINTEWSATKYYDRDWRSHGGKSAALPHLKTFIYI